MSDLHFHNNGSSCHGTSTLQECIDETIRFGLIGKILEQTYLRDGVKVKCYSLIVSKFDHWAKHGRFIAESLVIVRRLPR